MHFNGLFQGCSLRFQSTGQVAANVAKKSSTLDPLSKAYIKDLCSGQVDNLVEHLTKMSQRHPKNYQVAVLYETAIQCFLSSKPSLEAVDKLYNSWVAAPIKERNFGKVAGMYAVAGNKEKALSIFLKQPIESEKQWEAAIESFANSGDLKTAVTLLERWQRSGSSTQPTARTYTNLLSAFKNPEDLPLGKEIHKLVNASPLKKSLLKSVASMYTRFKSRQDIADLVNSSRREDLPSTVFDMYFYQLSREEPQHFRELYMQEDIPNLHSRRYARALFLGAFEACKNLRDLSWAKQIQKDLQRLPKGFKPGCSTTALIELLGKCGSLNDAIEIFEKDKDRQPPSWSAMLNCYVEHKQAPQPTDTFWKLRNEAPDQVKQSIQQLFPNVA